MNRVIVGLLVLMAGCSNATPYAAMSDDERERAFLAVVQEDQFWAAESTAGLLAGGEVACFAIALHVDSGASDLAGIASIKGGDRRLESARFYTAAALYRCPEYNVLVPEELHVNPLGHASHPSPRI